MRVLFLFLLSAAFGLTEAQTVKRYVVSGFGASDSVTIMAVEGSLSAGGLKVWRINAAGNDYELAAPTGIGNPVNATLPAFAGLTNSSTMLTTGFAGFGLSTTTPLVAANIAEFEAGNTNVSIGVAAHGASAATGFRGIVTGGTKGSPSATPADAFLVSLSGNGYGTGYVSSAKGFYSIQADGNWSGTNNGTYLSFTGTPNASTTAAEWARLYRGNLLLNTTSDNGARLQVSGTSTISGFAGFGLSTTTPVNASSIAEFEAGNVTNTIGIIAHGAAAIAGVRGIVTGGTKASPTATPDNGRMLFLGANGYGTAYVSGSRADISMFADGLWSGTNNGTYMTFTGTPNASVTPAEWARFYRGNFLIGTTSDNGARLQVSGTATVSGKLTGSDSIVGTLGIRSANYNIGGVAATFGGDVVLTKSLSVTEGTYLGNLTAAGEIRLGDIGVGNYVAFFDNSAQTATFKGSSFNVESPASFEDAIFTGNFTANSNLTAYNFGSGHYALTADNEGVKVGDGGNAVTLTAYGDVYLSAGAGGGSRSVCIDDDGKIYFFSGSC